MFQLEAHWISVKNWYWIGDISFVKRIHKKIELKKVRRENPKATSSARRVSCIKKRLIVPKKGSKIQVKRRFDPIFKLRPQSFEPDDLSLLFDISKFTIHGDTQFEIL